VQWFPIIHNAWNKKLLHKLSYLLQKTDVLYSGKTQSIQIHRVERLVGSSQYRNFSACMQRSCIHAGIFTPMAGIVLDSCGTFYLCPRKSIKWLMYQNLCFVMVNGMMVLGLWQNVYLWSFGEGSSKPASNPCQLQDFLSHNYLGPI